MTDTVEAIATRLNEFFEATQKNTRVPMGGMLTQMRRPSGKSKAPILAIYEAYLSKLEPEERGEFDRMIQKMLGDMEST